MGNSRQAEQQHQAAHRTNVAADKNVFMPYQKSIAQHKNNRDLRPVVNAIMKAENWILERMPPNQKLVVLLGEEHNTTTHIALQQAILSAHVKQQDKNPKRSFAYGYELAHSRLGIDIQQKSNKLIEKFLLEKNNILGEPQRKRLMRFCLEHDINVQFNDLSVIKNSKGFLINQKDTFSKKIIKQHAPEYLKGTFFGLLQNKIYRVSEFHDCALGLKLSNLAIVHHAKQHMSRTKVQIYFQQCGMAHALGDKEHNHIYQDSLAACFHEAGMTVLNLVPSAHLLSRYIPQEGFERENIIQEGYLDITENTSQRIWDDINAQSGGVLNDPAKVNLPRLQS